MKTALILPLLAALFAPPAGAGPVDLPPGLRSAALLPGWTDDAGNRVSALELVLEPGWKTYWRSPGDAGLPPEFDWQGSNIGAVDMHWPAPEVIESDGLRTLGYHDRLILPFTVRAQTAGQPVGISAYVTFGLCENVCIPAALTLAAPGPGTARDPRIEAALAQVPRAGPRPPACRITEAADGMTVTLSLPDPGAETAIEHGADPRIWVSSPEHSADGYQVSADFVAPAGKPFPLDPAEIVLTVLGDGGATEYHGCEPG
ncbi:MAG: protein-disulfide reductase DsbD family protein [Paracoccus sp. (in: a-proteobacteria)]|nr:protein-disulfide reductase DsbD family protein [Paracoccus sp. (in: a-proteobacteria)]